MDQMNLLKQGLEHLRINPSEKQISQLLNYASEILRWNKRSNLVKADDQSIITHHILDSLSPLEFFKTENPETMLDVGSGAGLPGIPLAIFLDKTRITLCERMSKRTGFLENMRLQLGLKNLDVFTGEYQDLKNNYDIITMRAFAALQDCIQGLAEKLTPRGRILALKGRLSTIAEELALLDNTLYSWQTLELAVPFLEKSERHLVIINKASS
ncbi:MAG: 16S rRNA (guanine(527)-N(7))-methyltransferase RsmG [Spirochaetales bacterium]|nr:16S rRNA (guanine(527)-N(7))-methyltransferase RsmG [Spirochaetales bacterium]